MLSRVRKFLKNNSPDWLNTEVNKDLLQNLTANIKSSQPTTLITTYEPTNINVLPSPRRRGARGEVKQDLAVSAIALEQQTIIPAPNTISKLEFPTPGTPHWRRIRQVFQALDNAPENATYNQLIEYVRQTTGKGCSRKLISKWKKQKLSQKSQVTSHKFRDHKGGVREVPAYAERHLEERTAAISLAPTIVNIPSTACQEMGVNNLHLTQTSNKSTYNNSLMTDNWSLMTVKAWSYLAAAGITIALVGCELLPLNNDRPNEKLPPASTAPLNPLPAIPERRKNRLEPRTIKIDLTLSNPQDLKVKPGDKVTVGQTLSDRADSRNRLQAKKKQLQLSLEKLNLPLTPIPQPKPIPEIAELPPVSYAEEEAAIKLKQQKLTEAEQAITIQQKKIDSIEQLLVSPTSKPTKQPATGEDNKASPNNWGKGGGNIKLILSHEQANLKNLEAARQSAQIQLEVAQSKLTTAKENRAYIEYQRQLEQTRRAIAVEQQHQSLQRTESERSRLLAEREYSKAQIETQIQAIDYQIHQLSTVTAPYEGTIKKVKWTGQSDHNLTAVVTLAVSTVSSQQSTVTSVTESINTQQSTVNRDTRTVKTE